MHSLLCNITYDFISLQFSHQVPLVHCHCTGNELTGSRLTFPRPPSHALGTATLIPLVPHDGKFLRRPSDGKNMRVPDPRQISNDARDTIPAA